MGTDIFLCIYILKMFIFVNFYWYLKAKFIKIRKIQCAAVEVHIYEKAVVKGMEQDFFDFFYALNEFHQQNQSR